MPVPERELLVLKHGEEDAGNEVERLAIPDLLNRVVDTRDSNNFCFTNITSIDTLWRICFSAHLSRRYAECYPKALDSREVVFYSSGRRHLLPIACLIIKAHVGSGIDFNRYLVLRVAGRSVFVSLFCTCLLRYLTLAVSRCPS